MANTENIEAKLAAYVDGELDASARAEIEQHLASNPQHRKLIDELMRTRRYLLELPRSPAPPEVAEILSNQLERAALLGDVDIGANGGSMRRSWWPQVRALAAVVVFTATLAGVLYYILPSPKAPPPRVAIVTPEPPPNADGERGVRGSELAKEDASPTAEPTVREELDRARSKAQPTNEVATAADNKSIDNPARDDNPARSGPAAAALPSEFTSAGGGGPTALYVVVNSPDPDGASVRVQQYLNDNGFTYQPLPQSIALGAIGRPTESAGKVVVDANTKAALDQTKPSGGGAGGAIAGSGLAGSAASNAAQVGEHAALAQVQPATTGPVAGLDQASTTIPVADVVIAATTTPAAPIAAPVAVPAAQFSTTQTVSGARMIIARNLTRQQVGELQAAFGLAGQKQEAMQGQAPGAIDTASPQVAPQQAIPPAPAMGETDRAGQTQQNAQQNRRAFEQQNSSQTGYVPAQARAQVSDALLPGDSVRIRAKDSALGLEPVDESQTVDADGNIWVPRVGKIQAAGLSPQELAKSLSQALPDEKLKTELAWSVDKLSYPNLQLKDVPLELKSPATAPSESATPATAPTIAVDDRVDVVILVRDEPALPSTAPTTTESAPTTQPTTSPAP